MTDLKSKIKSLNKDLIERLDALEAHTEYLKEGLKNLLDEEDVREIPSFDLLNAVYSEYLGSDIDKFKSKTKSASASASASKHNKEVAEKIYDPLYAPPKGRSRVNTASKKKFAEGQQEYQQPRVTRQRQSPTVTSNITASSASSASAFLPDFGESMLDDMGGRSKASVKARTKPAPTPAPTPAPAQKIISIKPKTDEQVYRVEIKGKEYMLHGIYLYGKESQLRVGTVENGCFVIDDVRINITGTTNMQEIEDTPYYQGDDNKVYIRVNDTVAQAVGEVNENDEVGLWA
jgi:hypothetical protein